MKIPSRAYLAVNLQTLMMSTILKLSPYCRSGMAKNLSFLEKVFSFLD